MKAVLVIEKPTTTRCQLAIDNDNNTFYCFGNRERVASEIREKYCITKCRLKDLDRVASELKNILEGKPIYL